MAKDFELVLKETFAADADEAPVASPELAHLVRSRVVRSRFVLAGLTSGALVAAAVTTVLVLAQPQHAAPQAGPAQILTGPVTPPTLATRPESVTTPPAVLRSASTSPSLPTTALRTGPLAGGQAMCVERYSPAALAHRAFAFDGTVTTIGAKPDETGDGTVRVTFAVSQWFHGGSGSTVTVDMQPPTAIVSDGGAVSGGGGPISPGEPATAAAGTASTLAPQPAYAVGARLLVSGEPRFGGAPLKHPVAWSCGFTRYYDAATAAQWQAAAQR